MSLRYPATLALAALGLAACSGGGGTGFDDTQTPTIPQPTPTAQAQPTPTSPGSQTPTATATEPQETTPTEAQTAPPTPTAPVETPTVGGTAPPTAAPTPEPTEAGTPPPPTAVPPTPPPTPPLATPTQPAGEQPFIVANNQVTGDATLVVVNEAFAEEPALAVIYTDDGGEPDAVLGAAALALGSNPEVEVRLSQAVGSGQTLWAVLHQDADEDGQLDFPGEDGLLLDGRGQPVRASFQVEVLTAGVAAISVHDQYPDPPVRILIDGVSSVGPGWVVIHEEAEGGGPGPVLGQTSVPDGVSLKVAVDMLRDGEIGETLYAMLHTDVGEVGVYEFPGVDVPAKDTDGNTVVRPLVLIDSGGPQGGAFIEAEPQTPGSSTAVAVRVSANGPSWLVLHQDDAGEGALGPALGHAAVGAGITEDVQVPLSRTLADGEPVAFALYVDAGQVGTYEVPSPDVPETDDLGLPVIRPVSVGNGGSGGPDVAYVDVQDQKAGDTTALALGVGIAVDGWLAVHEDSSNGLGPALGHTQVDPGQYADIGVELSRSLRLGEVVLFVLYADQGEVGVFEPDDLDPILTDDLGSEIIRPVNVTSTGGGPGGPGGSGSLQIQPQPSGVYSMHVERIDAPQAGLLAILEDDDGEPGAVLGVKAVSAGVEDGPNVVISRPSVDGEKLWAGLYVDANGNSQLDLPGPDSVMTDADGPILVSFDISGPAPTPPP